MINKRLVGMVPGSMGAVWRNVAVQWLGLLCNIATILAIGQLLGSLLAGTFTMTGLLACAGVALGGIAVRFICAMASAKLSFAASEKVKLVLRQRIYQKLLALGPGYHQKVSTSEAVQVAVEGVDQLEVLQFRQGSARLRQMEEQTEALGEKQRQMKFYEGLTTALSNTAILAFSLAVLFVGVLLYQSGVVDFAGVLIPFIAAISSFGPVVALANLSNNLLQTFAAADRVLDILDEEPVTLDVEDGVDVAFDGMGCEDVCFAYGEEPVLKDFCLEVRKGGVLGIQGKSTLLRLMMRFWNVDGGCIAMSGRDVRGVNTVKVANPAATRQQVEEACKKASVHNFIETLPQGCDTNVGELGDGLSGGERQRIGLARAFLYDAPLLLDEPTSNLDSLNEGVVLRSLQRESTGRTVVLVSHRASSLDIADEVVQVQRGRCS